MKESNVCLVDGRLDLMMVMDKSYSSSITFIVFGQRLDVSLKKLFFIIMLHI